MRLFMMIIFALSAVFAGQNEKLPEIYSTKISDLEIHIISLAKSTPPVEKLIPNNNDDKKFIAKVAKKLPQNNQNIMLLKHKDFVALVDTGFPHTATTLQAQLKKLGVTPRDITHLIITHAHIDHIGGILYEGKNQFSNATMLIDKNEYDFWINSDNDSAKSALLAFKDKMTFFNDKNLLNNALGLDKSDLTITNIPAYGHTAGHTMIGIASGNERLVFIADLIHAFDIQMARPKIAIKYDENPSDAIKARINFLDSLKGDSKTQIIGAHLPFVEPKAIKID